MTEWPPSWWVNVSGLFFILAILLVIGLGIAVFMLMQKLKTIQGKVEQTVDKAEKVVERLEGVAQSAQKTVDSLGASARNVAGRVEGAVSKTVERAEPFADILTIAMTGLKLYQHLSEMKKAKDRRMHHHDDEEGWGE